MFGLNEKNESNFHNINQQEEKNAAQETFCIYRGQGIRF
jgi:hypothetical protein